MSLAITCDGKPTGRWCEAVADSAVIANNGRIDYRLTDKRLAVEGWHSERGRHLCPDCVAAYLSQVIR